MCFFAPTLQPATHYFIIERAAVVVRSNKNKSEHNKKEKTEELKIAAEALASAEGSHLCQQESTEDENKKGKLRKSPHSRNSRNKAKK